MNLNKAANEIEDRIKKGELSINDLNDQIQIKTQLEKPINDNLENLDKRKDSWFRKEVRIKLNAIFKKLGINASFFVKGKTHAAGEEALTKSQNFKFKP